MEEKKYFLRNVFLLLATFQVVSSNVDWLEKSKSDLIALRNSLGSYQNQKADIIFLIDTSGSLSGSNFNEEKRFVVNLLNEISVGFEATRVEVIPFGSSAGIFIDQISNPANEKNKCSFNEKFNPMPQSIYGWMTNMRDAFDWAYQVCFGTKSGAKRDQVSSLRTIVILLTDGYWNYPYGDSSPVSRAQSLFNAGVEVLAIGVGWVNFPALQTLVKEPSQQAFYLSNFDQFSELATYIRGDPYEATWQTTNVDSSKCGNKCHNQARCSCGLVYGDYKCGCLQGWAGNGEQCEQCPHSTYKDFDGYALTCTSCPANSGHSIIGSFQRSDCECHTGYEGRPEDGEDCTIRRCQALPSLSNGRAIGACERDYAFTCKFECSQGYKLEGSKERTCIINAVNKMDWNGTTTVCTLIKCPVKQVPYAAPPIGVCRDPDGVVVHDYVFETKCTFECDRGYNMIGSPNITCQLDETWSPSLPSCEEVRCAKLPSVRMGTYIPSYCDTNSSKFDSTCKLDCPAGYHINLGDTTLTQITRRCYTNGSWDYRAQAPDCVDHEAPVVSCPPFRLVVDNDAGTNVATVSWNFSFTDNSLTSMEPGVSADDFTIELIIGNKTYNSSLPKLLGIGATTVQYIVTDKSNNTDDSCIFEVRVTDTEPPICWFCPADINILNTTKDEIRVNWQQPNCTDNSGIPPSVEVNKQSGELLDVGNTYVVSYKYIDGDDNENSNCSFRIVLEKKSCPLYAPPKNGALACNTIGSDKSCTVYCRKDHDFAVTPPLLYYCSAAEWQFWGFPGVQFSSDLPWPDCGASDNPSGFKAGAFAPFEFDGDCNDPNVQESLKTQFLNLLHSPFIPTFFCENKPTQCNETTIEIYCGELTAADKRRKRSTTMQVSFRYDYVDTDTGLAPGTTDQGGQDAYNNEKITKQSDMDAVQAGFDNVNWVEFKAQSNLTILNNDPSNLQLSPIDAYCAEDGSVVRKCEQSDLNCFIEEGQDKSCQCNKKDGSITKCTRCPVGTFYDKGADDCLLCPEGTYNDNEGALFGCYPCPEGTWTYGDRKENFTSCTEECGPGLYSPTGIAKCFRCPAGTYSSGERNRGCTDCPAGTSTVIDAAPGIEDCGMQCAPGTYSDNGVEPCLPCSVGTYQPGSGQKSCLPCPGQESTHGTGASSDLFCGEVDTCISSPCMNDGTCVNTKESYRCDCPPGFNGVNCENDINECLLSPCYGGATCLDKINDFTCLCNAEYTGKKCELSYSICAQRQPCQNSVGCIDKLGTFECQCSEGYGEKYCEMDLDECASSPCQNNGVCISGLDSYSCLCPAGFSGVNCQINIDECDPNPCQNNGTCVDDLSSYTCQCPTGYSGINCETIIDHCIGQPCKNGGSCVNSPTGYSCVCAPSYHKCRCTEELSSDYDLSFQVRAVKSYSQLKKPVPDLTAFTLAFWMRTSDANPGTPISYATIDGNVVQDNALAFQDYAAFNLVVNNISVFTGLRANDGQWHHVAVTWESSTGSWRTYKDGALDRSSTVAFRQGEVIKGGGILVVGQEQDELGGGFNTEENFIGDISQVNIWDYALSPTDITNIVYSCEHLKGNVAAWGDFRESLQGDYIATTPSYACDFSNDFRKFVATYKRQIIGDDELTLSNTTPESCASSCLAEASFVCRSFDFDNSTNTCYLSSKSTVDKTLDDSDANYNYYELGCLEALGVSTARLISNGNMTASSEKDSVSVASNGRLNQQRVQTQDGTITEDGAWSPSSGDANPWLQIKFDAVKQISAVATQGHSAETRWVTSYSLDYSTDGSNWASYPETLNGNSDQDTIARNEVNIFQAQYVRFRPQAHHTEIAMRVEVYGCLAPFTKPADATDECSPSPCQNGGTCLNLYDDYYCTCPTGFLGKNCDQTAACATLGAPIHGTMSASGSTVTFSCDAGYSLQGSSSRTCHLGSWTGSHPKCNDIDECASNTCNQGCTNTPGSYVCHCNEGYELQQGSNTCVDIDECASSNGGCSHLCHNSVGSYSCSCPSGLVLESIGQRSCKDVDECTSSNGGCVHLCVNTFQSFYCACRQGYNLGADQRSCTAVSCPALGTPANGAVSLSSGLVLSSTAMYSCNNGFQPTHSTDRVCQADEQWSGSEPSCIRVYCEEIGQVEHATRVLTGAEGVLSVTGTTATFTCAANYAMVGDGVRTCQGDGTWSGIQPRCIASLCNPVPVPDYGAVQGYRYELGATLRISCDEGHNLVPASSSFRTCNSDGQGGGVWSGQDPTCELVDCGDPGDPYGGYRHIATDTKYQSKVTYTCKPLHHLEGETSQECLRNGSWSGSKPVCLERSCGNPGTPENGAKYGPSYKYGDTVTFSCNTGYNLLGSASRTCQESDALWTGTQPTCQIADCGDPGTPTNGERYGDTFTYQSIVQFECHPQYKLTGDLFRTCQADGQWSGSVPSCVDTNCGTFLIGPTGTVTSTNYPSNYDNNEYCTWEIRVPVDKKVRLDFSEFKTETGKDFLYIFDTNELTPTIYFDGTSYKPPSFTSSGNVVRVRFITDGATTMKGFSFDYKQVDTDCGGVIKGGEGVLSSPGYPAGYASNLDCVWLLYRVGETVDFIFSDFNTEASYDVVKITTGRFGETTETSGWGGLSIPRGSFYTDSYLWMQFTTDNIIKDSKHYTGWSGRYSKYWPYVNKKKRDIASLVK